MFKCMFLSERNQMQLWKSPRISSVPKPHNDSFRKMSLYKHNTI